MEFFSLSECERKLDQSIRISSFIYEKFQDYLCTCAKIAHDNPKRHITILANKKAPENLDDKIKGWIEEENPDVNILRATSIFLFLPDKEDLEKYTGLLIDKGFMKIKWNSFSKANRIAALYNILSNESVFVKTETSGEIGETGLKTIIPIFPELEFVTAWNSDIFRELKSPGYPDGSYVASALIIYRSFTKKELLRGVPLKDLENQNEYYGFIAKRAPEEEE